MVARLPSSSPAAASSKAPLDGRHARAAIPGCLQPPDDRGGHGPIDIIRITGGGVTAGVDFGLRVVAEINGQHAAEITQLALEYDPQPPFTAGHPRSSRPEVIACVEGMMAHMITPGVELARAYREALVTRRARLMTA